MSQDIHYTIENVDPGHEFDTGACVRCLTGDKYDSSVAYMEQHPEINEFNICTFYGGSHVQGTPAMYKWDMYRHEGLLWVRVFKYDRIVQQYCMSKTLEEMKAYIESVKAKNSQTLQ